MKRILILQPVLAHYRKSVYELISKSDHEVFFVSGKSYQGIKSFTIRNSYLLDFKVFSFLKHSFYYLTHCRKQIKKINPDIVISSGIDPHMIHQIVIFFWQKFIKCKKFIWWSHVSAGKQGRLGFNLRFFFYKKSDGILCYNREGYDLLLEKGIPAEKLTTLGNALNTDDYGFLNHQLTKKKTKEKFTMLFSGRIYKERRLDILFQAIKILVNKGIPLNCIVIGNGDTSDLEYLSKELNIEKHVKFTGALYGKDNHKYLLQSDLVVYPKAIGLSLVQAFSFGIPVVTSNKDQMPEIELLKPGSTGDFYKDESVEDLADVIEKWYFKIKENRNVIQDNCINSIHEMGYLPEKVAEKVLQFISNI